MIERYAASWSIEIAIEDAKQVFGTGQARNRTAAAVERTVPFQIACQAVAVTWYATAGHDPADLHERRALAPWYTSKAEPATADMAAKLRRVIIAARFKASRPDQPTPQEISRIRLAWEDADATRRLNPRKSSDNHRHNLIQQALECPLATLQPRRHWNCCEHDCTADSATAPGSSKAAATMRLVGMD